MEDYSEKIKQLIESCKNKGFEYGKPISYLEFRNGCSKEELEREIINCKELIFTEKQIKNNEKRYKLYFIYSKRTGRVYVLTFKDKIRIITIYPLGRSTVKRYYQAKFKK